MEMRCQIAVSKSAIIKLCDVTCNNKISRKTRKRLIQSFVFFTFLYIAETLALKMDDSRRIIDAFEMWICQRTLKVLWITQWTNNLIVNEIPGATQAKHFGHVTRREVGNLEKDILFGKAPAKRGRERSPTRWSDSDFLKVQTCSRIRAALQAWDCDWWRGGALF